MLSKAFPVNGVFRGHHLKLRSINSSSKRVRIDASGLRSNKTAISFYRSFESTHVVQPEKVASLSGSRDLSVVFIDKYGKRRELAVSAGETLLEIAQQNDVDMEGACGGACACSTCHAIVSDQRFYNKIKRPAEDEIDMLDLAFGLTETSRLGCQVQIVEQLDGIVIRLPSQEDMQE